MVFSLTYNVLQLTEVGDYEAQNFNLLKIMIRSNTVQFTTKPPILVRCCYLSGFIFIFCEVAFFSVFSKSFQL
jgi:hypothetical protein